LEAAEVSGNAPGNYAQVYQSQLSAIFFPTSYGAVSAASPNRGTHPEATAISAGDESNGEVTGTAYMMDLRYYELKARAAQEAARKAQLELEQARIKSEQAKRSATVNDRR